jgi:hypothetical protein
MRIRNAVSVAAPVAAALALASSASASPAIGGAARPQVLGSNAASHSGIPNPFFAGWAVAGGDGRFTETATIVLPKLKCGKAQQAIDPDVGTDINANSSADSAGVFVGCVGGKARYFPAFTVEGTFKNFPKLKAKAGDKVVLKEVINTARPGKLSVVDKTTKSASKTVTIPAVTDTDHPWVGDDAWSKNGGMTLWPVPHFGTITFSHTRFLGEQMRKFFPHHEMAAFDRYKSPSTLQIKTGKWASDLETFKTVFHHS